MGLPEREGSSVTPSPEEEQRKLDARTEQCHWRLERLLGGADKRAPAISTPPNPESICTEDLTECCREETVELDEKSRAESFCSMPCDTGKHKMSPNVTTAFVILFLN